MTVALMPRPITSHATSFEGDVMAHKPAVFRTTEIEFREIVEGYSDSANRIALRMLHNAADADDAVQEAFMSAYRGFSNFKGQSKVTSWLYRIVVNACLMKIRKENCRAKHLPETGYDDAVVHDWRNDPEKAAINAELRDVLHNGLGRLCPEVRALIVLRDVQGLSNQEAAEALDLPVALFKSRLRRARVLLRKYLEGYLADLPGCLPQHPSRRNRFQASGGMNAMF